MSWWAETWQSSSSRNPEAPWQQYAALALCLAESTHNVQGSRWELMCQRCNLQRDQSVEPYPIDVSWSWVQQNGCNSACNVMQSSTWSHVAWSHHSQLSVWHCQQISMREMLFWFTECMWRVCSSDERAMSARTQAWLNACAYRIANATHRLLNCIISQHCCPGAVQNMSMDGHSNNNSPSK